ncbi:MAG: AEC family transporter [Clostridiaceae bacterium]
MLPVVSQMGILFAAVALGFIGAKFGVLRADANEQLSKLVLNLTLPCSVLYSALGAERLLDNRQILILTLIACATAGIMVLLAAGLTKMFGIPLEQRGVTKFMLIFTNSAFIGFPVLRVLFGASSIFYASIFNLAFMVLSYTYGVALIGGRENTRLTWRMVLTPMVISSLLAYAVYLTGFHAPEFLVNTLKFIDPVTSPLSLMTIGCALATQPMKGAFRAWRVHGALALRMFAFPTAYYFCLRLFIVNPVILGVTTIIVAMPAAASTTMFCAKYGGDQALASAGVFITTVLSIASIPLLAGLLLRV